YEVDSTEPINARGGDNNRRELTNLSHWPSEGIWAFSTNSDFDGLGHYRATNTGGNFPAPAANQHTTTISFNKRDQDVNPFSGPNVGMFPDSFTMWSTTDPWIINTY